jgi:hypothetical protein
MNNIISNQIKKIIILVIILLVISSALFLLTSCKNDGSKVLDKGNISISNESTADTTTDTVTNTTNQTTTSGIETTTETSKSGTETTSQGAKQIIEVIANSGGYSPGKIDAKAGVPTTLVMKSEGAYGCERSFNVLDPVAKKVLQSKILPENGETEFDLGTQAAGIKLIGVCSMGMYYFQITFN